MKTICALASIILAAFTLRAAYQAFTSRYSTNEEVVGFVIVTALLLVNARVHWKASDSTGLLALWVEKRKLETQARIRELKSTTK
jgi:hypothetical protein